jgi:hypothetical protein
MSDYTHPPNHGLDHEPNVLAMEIGGVPYVIKFCLVPSSHVPNMF